MWKSGKVQIFKFEIVKNIGVLSVSKSGWRKEINLVSWDDKPPKIDIREWSPDHSKMGKGVGLTDDEARTLTNILAKALPENA